MKYSFRAINNLTIFVSHVTSKLVINYVTCSSVFLPLIDRSSQPTLLHHPSCPRQDLHWSYSERTARHHRLRCLVVVSAWRCTDRRTGLNLYCQLVWRGFHSIFSIHVLCCLIHTYWLLCCSSKLDMTASTILGKRNHKISLLTVTFLTTTAGWQNWLYLFYLLLG